jgi:hypothetical protein
MHLEVAAGNSQLVAIQQNGPADTSAVYANAIGVQVSQKQQTVHHSQDAAQRGHPFAVNVEITILFAPYQGEREGYRERPAAIEGQE